MPPRTDSREVISPVKKIRCVLVHDHVLLRQGLRRLLEDEPDIEVVTEAGNAAECMRKIFEAQPDVLVADAATFGLSTREAELLVARESSHTKIIFLSAQEHASSPPGALRAAAAGCAARHTSAEELVKMVRGSRPNQAERSEPAEFFSAGPIHAVLQQPPAEQPWQPSVATLFPRERALTGREREVLKLLAEGKTVRAAAIVLGLSSKTVDAHKFNLMRKLGIHNKAELVMWAIQKRIVKIPANF